MLRLHMARLLEKAKKLGDLSVADVALRTGINASTLHRLASGQTEPRINTLWTLRSTYGGRLDSLVYDDAETPRPTVPRQRETPARERRTRAAR